MVKAGLAGSPHMRRRDFISIFGGAAATWPLAARAQQPGKIPRIGIIDDAPRWNGFRHGLRDLGYLEGQNIAFDYAYGDGVPERLAEAAAALVRRPVDVIATFGTPASLAAKQATTTIPIVMISIGDPVRAKSSRASGAVVDAGLADHRRPAAIGGLRFRVHPRPRRPGQ
jgi:ABC transporter substrate binding protein